VRVLLFRCAYSHYFRNGSCPYDAWTHASLAKAEDLFASNPAVEISDLAAAGIPSDLVQRVIIVESESLPEGIEGVCLKSFCAGGVVTELGLWGEKLEQGKDEPRL